MSLPSGLVVCLTELIGSEQDVREHFVRHPVVHPGEYHPFGAADPLACRASWRRVCARREAAQTALLTWCDSHAEELQ